jgi:kynureninase
VSAALDQSDARGRDAARALAPFRGRFVVDEAELLYLDGNSLGRLPVAARERVREVVEHEWGARLIRSWGERWFDATERLGEALAPLLGAGPGQVTFADSTSVNLYKLAHAALTRGGERRTIVTDALNFPSDVYVLQGVARACGARLVVVPGGSDHVHADEDAIIAAIDDDTALVTLSHVAFKSGYRYDAARITAAAHERGALVLWDLSHSVGAVEIALDTWGADLAIGCGYKYLNGGPGAPAFLYVARELQEALVSPIWGWFGERDPFAFDLQYRPVEGIRRFTVGTPPVLSLLALEPGIALLREAGMRVIEAEARALTDYLIALVDARLAPLGFRLASPRAPGRRGSHVSIAHHDAYRISRALIAREVIPDFRAPDSIRFGVAPLYVGFEDLWLAVDRLVTLVERGEHLAWDSERAAVT